MERTGRDLQLTWGLTPGRQSEPPQRACSWNVVPAAAAVFTARAVFQDAAFGEQRVAEAAWMVVVTAPSSGVYKL